MTNLVRLFSEVFRSYLSAGIFWFISISKLINCPTALFLWLGSMN